MGARSDTSGSWCGRGVRAVCAPGAGRPHGLTEGATDRGLAVALRSWRPHDAPLPWRADRGSAVPGDPPGGCRNAVRSLPLPTLVAWHRAPQVDPGRAPTRPEVGGPRLPRLDALGPRCPLPRGEVVLERGPPSHFGGGRWGGQDSGEAMGRLVIPGGGAMPRGPWPLRLAPCAGAGRRGLGGPEQQRRGRQG